MTKLEMIADGRTIRPWKGYEPFWISCDNIFDAYNRPGIKKLEIWRRIQANANYLNATVGIHSKNCNYFTCHGFMNDEEGRGLEFKLTKSYCYFRYR